MKEIERVCENMYNFSFGAYCGVILDEYLMKKIAKLQYQTEVKLKELLLNNKEHIEVNDWSLAYPNGEQTIFNYINSTSFQSKEDRINLSKYIFTINKIENLYKLNIPYYENDKKVKEFVKNDIEMLTENSKTDKEE